MEPSKGSPENEVGETTEEQELHEHHRIVADPGQGLMRLDKFLFDHLAGAPRARASQPPQQRQCAGER